MIICTNKSLYILQEEFKMKEFNVNMKERTLTVVDDNDNIQEWNIVPKCDDTTTSDLDEIISNLDKLCQNHCHDEDAWKIKFSSVIRNEILRAYLNSNKTIIDILICEEHQIDTGMRIRLRFDETGKLIDMVHEDKYEYRGAINNKDLREFVDLIFEKNDKMIDSYFTLNTKGDVLAQLKREINTIYENEPYKDRSLVVDGSNWEYQMTLINDSLPDELFKAKYETFNKKNVSVLEVEVSKVSNVDATFYVHIYFNLGEITELMISPISGQIGYVHTSEKINNPHVRNLLREMMRLFDINE